MPDPKTLLPGLSSNRELPRSRFPFEGLLVLGLYIVITLAFFAFWLPTLGTALIGPPEDNMQDYWNSWYAAYAGDWRHFFFTNLIRFPEGTPLVYHSFAYPMVAAIAVLAKVFGAPTHTLILLQNLFLLSSFPLAGLGAFYLVRHITGAGLGALIGGFVYAFNPSHVEHVMHHAHVSQIEFIPFFALAYLLAVERRTVLWLVAAVACYALCALSCWYYLFYCGYFVVFHTVFTSVWDRRWPRLRQLAIPLVTLLGTAVVLSPILVPMVLAALGKTNVYQPGDDWYVADVFAYIAFPPFHWLRELGAPIYASLGPYTNEWEGTVYLGIANLALLCWLYASGFGKDAKLLAYLLAGALVFMVFASGDSLHILGRHTLPMPDLLLAKLPFFKNVRTPSRAVVFVYLFLGIAVGHALNRLAKTHPGTAGVAVTGVISALIILDFAPATPLPSTPYVCSAGLAVIRDDPERDFAVLDLPNGKKPKSYRPGNLYMFQQTCHDRPILQGNISRDVSSTLRDRLNVADVAAQLVQLREAHVKYVVINHAPMGVKLDPQPADADLAEYAHLLPALYNGPDLSVYRVY